MINTAAPASGPVNASRRRFLVFIVAVVSADSLAILWIGEPAVDVGRLLEWVVVLGWALGIERLMLRDLGFTSQRLGRNLGLGLLVGLAMSVPMLVFFAFPLIVPGPVRYAGFLGLDLPSFLEIWLLRLSLNTVLLEETLFRGVIQECGGRRWGPARGIALSCALFVLWHATLLYRAIPETNLVAGPVPFPVLYVLTALPLGGAALIFSLLRHFTGSLASSILAHWIVDTSMVFFLALQPTAAAS